MRVVVADTAVKTWWARATLTYFFNIGELSKSRNPNPIMGERHSLYIIIFVLASQYHVVHALAPISYGFTINPTQGESQT